MEKNKLVFESAHKLFVMLTVTNHSEIINHMIEIQSLANLTEFLNSPNQEIIKLTLFGISNIAVDNHFSAGSVLKDEALIFRLLHLMDSKHEALRKETCWAVLNALSNASPDDLSRFHSIYSRDYIKRLI
jgi:hypothetical protein